MWDHAEAVLTRVLGKIAAQSGGAHQDRHQSGRGRVLRPEIRICAARRHRPRLAVRHHAGRFQPAGAVRRVLYRRDGEKSTPVMVHRAICGSMERFTGILIEHYRRALPAVAGAAAGRGVPRSRTMRTATPSRSPRRPPRRACASRPTCATRRSTTRCASTRWPRCRSSSRSASKEAAERTVSIAPPRLARPDRPWRSTSRCAASRRKPCRRT